MVNESEQSDRKRRFCVMAPCVGQRFDLVHKFPSDKERAELWRKIANVPDLYQYSIEEVRKKMFICSKHFAKRDYKHMESRSLNKTAIPTLHLRINDNEDHTINHVENVSEITIDTPTRKRRYKNSENSLTDIEPRFETIENALTNIEPKVQTIENAYQNEVDDKNELINENTSINQLVELVEPFSENNEIMILQPFNEVFTVPMTIEETHMEGFKISEGIFFMEFFF